MVYRGRSVSGRLRAVTSFTSLPMAWSLPSREEMRDMFRHPGVAVAAVVMGGLVLLGALGAITYLASTGKGTEAIGGLLLGILGLVLGKLQTLQRQTNGAQSRLLDAALSGQSQQGGLGGQGGQGGPGGQGGQGTIGVAGDA